MNRLLISYDLWWPETSSDYKELIDKIKSYWDYKKWLESFRFIKTNKLPPAVRDELSPLLDKNDKLIVIDITNKWWASFRLPSDVTDWLKK